MRKDGAKPSISTRIPGGVRAGAHSHHFLVSRILQKQAPVLETLEGSVPSSPWWLSLRAGSSVQRNCLQGNKIFFSQPGAGSLPRYPSLKQPHLALLTPHTPHAGTQEKLCATGTGTAAGGVTGTAAKGSRQARGPSTRGIGCCWHPAPRQPFPQRERGAGRAPCAPLSAPC